MPGQPADIDATQQPPQQDVRVMEGLGLVLGHPALGPRPQRHDRRQELFAAGREAIRRLASWNGRIAGDQTETRERSKTTD